MFGKKKDDAEYADETITAEPAEESRVEAIQAKTINEESKTGIEPLLTVETLIERTELENWEAAGLRVFAKWPIGKEITDKSFQKTLSAFKNRQQGA